MRSRAVERVGIAEMAPSHMIRICLTLALGILVTGLTPRTRLSLQRRAPVRMMSTRQSDSTSQLRYFGPKSTPLLDAINCPADMDRLTLAELKQLSYELRWDTVNAVSKTGGHLGSSLGVIELTVALHYVFDAPEDKVRTICPSREMVNRSDIMVLYQCVTS